MKTNLTNKLEIMKEKILHKETLERKAKDTTQLINEKEVELIRFEYFLNKEKKDVDKLKRLTLTSIFAGLTGTKADRLTKEEEEYIATKIKYDRHLFELQDMKSRLIYYNKQLDEINGLEEEFNVFLIQKRNELVNSSSLETAKKIEDLMKEEDSIARELIEIRQAYQAGEKCHNSLKNTVETLNSARNWGTADIIMGKSMIVSMIKHGKLEDASQQIRETNAFAKRYSKELSDVHLALGKVDLEFSGLLRTLDIFFDNIFSDLSVQRKIADSHDKVKEALHNVIRIQTKLRSTKLSLQSKSTKIKEDIESITLDFSL